MAVPHSRLRALNAAPERAGGAYVLYWMIASRRASHSYALDRVAELSRRFGRPPLVLEALRAGYPHASDRLHRFVLDGMADNASAFAQKGVAYYPYLEARPGDGHGLLEALSTRACTVVTDDYPCFFLPRMVSTAAARLKVRLEAVDGNGLLPMSAAPRVFNTAFSFRGFLQKELSAHLADRPAADPWHRRALPPPPDISREIALRWPAAKKALLAPASEVLAGLEIDHRVAPVPLRGGTGSGRAALRRFVDERLTRYEEDRNHPDLDGSSGLSPFLHFGHLSSHEVFEAVTRAEGWAPHHLGAERGGRRRGFWGLSAGAEAFLDQLVTWRELGLNMCSKRDDYLSYDSLPPWARETLHRHARDRRSPLYHREAFEAAETHDPLWNAAQRQLLGEGRIHNYLRMLWGKKILEWSAAPEEALATMIALNDRYALDGRDPNSYSGILWCLGRYDRPWGPERAILGKVRFMSSENTARKVRVKRYLERYGEGALSHPERRGQLTPGKASS
ncbi:MAG TPA: deoxyribodipyrimidine photolyase [Anaeromyxobacteraceae bacterium]|nr:deoxyribodipyrimidine photolyase [Anaeromyxobacteraceae bacterium]